jgi:hypothetical protein
MQIITRTFESSSSSAVHTARFNPATGEACTCPGFTKFGSCWHVRTLRDESCPPRCPECGGVVQLVRDGFVLSPCVPGYITPDVRVEHRPRLAPFGACTACEFCIEVRFTGRKE